MDQYPSTSKYTWMFRRKSASQMYNPQNFWEITDVFGNSNPLLLRLPAFWHWFAPAAAYGRDHALEPALGQNVWLLEVLNSSLKHLRSVGSMCVCIEINASLSYFFIHCIIHLWNSLHNKFMPGNLANSHWSKRLQKDLDFHGGKVHQQLLVWIGGWNLHVQRHCTSEYQMPQGKTREGLPINCPASAVCKQYVGPDGPSSVWSSGAGP